MDFTVRSTQKELLDSDNIPFDAIQRNMQELNTINHLLGGHAISLEGFKKLLGGHKNITVAEIGCGGGDNLEVLIRYCKKNEITIQCIGIDYNENCIQFAITKRYLNSHTQFICSDYKAVTFTDKPDIIFSSLFCHHFSDSQLEEQIRWMELNSKLGFFINDLERNPLAYYSIKLLTYFFSKSYLVKNDAPLSVARGFKKKEWQSLFNKLGFSTISIQWKWAFRYLIVKKHANF